MQGAPGVWSQNAIKMRRVFPEEGSLTQGVKTRAGRKEACLLGGEAAGAQEGRRELLGVEGRHREAEPGEKHTHTKG